MATETPFGVHSEVGTLRKVLVCAPGRARAADPDQLRLAAVRRRAVGAERQARPFRLHDQDARARVEVVEMHELLAETLATRPPRPGCSTARSPRTRSASAWSRTPGPISRAWTRALAETMLGGLSANELPDKYASNISTWCARRPASRNTCCRRCRTPSSPATTCWIYGGVTVNPLYWPAREETLLATAIYKFHELRQPGPGLVGRRT